MIGRHGQTLEALNLVFNNIVNAGVRKDRHYFTIDAEGYRARRADVLKGLALQSLERAMREKRPIALDAMLPSERKVIHMALADNPFVKTESTGVEPERRVVVIPENVACRGAHRTRADDRSPRSRRRRARGAIAIVRLSGPQALAIARRVVPRARPCAIASRPSAASSIARTARDRSRLALFFAGPRSYTGEDVVELHVHGSPARRARYADRALAAGARLARPRRVHAARLRER